MSEISVGGLRQAFLDPESRVRLSSDPPPEGHAEIRRVAWEGGFLDGVAIHFNQNLNVLVGGRGAGKSTVIESLRYALALEPMGEQASKTHDGMVRNVLRAGTKISVFVRTHRPTAREYLIERTVPNPPVVRDESGSSTNLLPNDILPRVEIYGQHEISELARSPNSLTRLLDRFSEGRDALVRRKEALRLELESSRRALVDVRAELSQIGERLASLPALQETLGRYREAGLEDRLREQSLLVREERILDSIPERVSGVRESLDLLRQQLPIDADFLSPRSLEALPGRDILAGARPPLERLSVDLQGSAEAIAEALERCDEAMGSVGRRWQVRKGEVESQYQEILRQLQQSAVDGEEFIRLRKEVEDLQPLQRRQAILVNLEAARGNERRRLLAEWDEIQREDFSILDGAARDVSSRLKGRVKVEVTRAGDREILFRALKEEIGGRLAETVDRIDKLPDFSLSRFVTCCREGAETLKNEYAIPLAQAQSLSEASAEILMRLEELELSPSTVVRLNTAPAGTPTAWRALADLSTGQKATAVLLLLMLESDVPLIVDQPEDDLDNRFISDEVVRRVRLAKRRRQFVFSTHNANIPVLGDAELILGLTPSGEGDSGVATIAQEHVGAIDSVTVRELVEDILEGGKAAFETRRLKYGF